MHRAAAPDSVTLSTHSAPCAPAEGVFDSLSVADLTPHRITTIIGLAEPDSVARSAGMAQRLAELGFIVGETVSVLHRGPGGREPIAVQVGDTVFALRRIEAGCIRVRALA